MWEQGVGLECGFGMECVFGGLEWNVFSVGSSASGVWNVQFSWLGVVESKPSKITS